MSSSHIAVAELIVRGYSQRAECDVPNTTSAQVFISHRTSSSLPQVEFDQRIGALVTIPYDIIAWHCGRSCRPSLKFVQERGFLPPVPTTKQ